MCVHSLNFTSSPPLKSPFASPKSEKIIFSFMKKISGALIFLLFNFQGGLIYIYIYIWIDVVFCCIDIGHNPPVLQAAPVPCRGGCGFCGTARTDNYCGVPGGHFCTAFGKSGGDFFEKTWETTPKRKVWLIILNLGPTAGCYVTITHYAKKKRWCQVFFFQVCFGDFAQLKLLPSEHFPKKSMVLQAPNAMRRSRKRRSMGWASKAPVGYCCLSPGNPRVLQKWVDTLGVCFLSQMSFFLQTSSKQKPSKTQALVANDGSLGSQGRCPV